MLLLTFTAGANRYGIDAARVIEVIPRVELRTIPHSPAILGGLLSYRGQVVPVVDLSLLLSTLPSQNRLSTRIILVSDAHDHGNVHTNDLDTSRGKTAPRERSHGPHPHLIGLIAEDVIDVTLLQPSQISSAPVLLPEAPYLGAIVKTDAGIAQLIVVEQIRQASLLSSYLRQAAVPVAQNEPAILGA